MRDVPPSSALCGADGGWAIGAGRELVLEWYVISYYSKKASRVVAGW
jgi:hypothetical protein